MPRSYGVWLRKYIDVLRNWRTIVSRLAELVVRVDPDAEVYVFGSIINNKYTGSSDIDVIVVTRGKDPKKVYQELSMLIDRELGSLISQAIDLHIVPRREKNKPPYKWWLEKALRIH